MRRHHGRSPFANKVAAPLSDAATLLRTFETETNPARPMRPSPLASSQIQDMPLDLIDRIRSFPLFQSTPESFLAEVGAHLRPQMHKTNDYILTEGEDAKAMYWLVRGQVSVTSRDGESVYAELRPGAFFGEIGILMQRPRTATIVAKARCLLVVLKKEDLQKILPKYPDVEQAIREEAQERLMILERKKKERQPIVNEPATIPSRRGSKRVREQVSEDLGRGTIPDLGVIGGKKKRKSPSPGLSDYPHSSALGNGLVNVRLLLKELPLFADLPPDILHFLGLNAQPCTYPPFTDIIKQDSMGREVYFIVHGEAEVLDEHASKTQVPTTIKTRAKKAENIKARLKQGQYFGEVVSLSLAPRRTATVRSVTAVECLMISGEVLAEFWARCPMGVRQQVEKTAHERLGSASDNDVIMKDQVESTPAIDELAIGDKTPIPILKQPTPKVTFNDFDLNRPLRNDDSAVLEPSDPDPYLSVGLDKVRSRSRRGSLAPLPPDEKPSEVRRKSASPPGSRAQTPGSGRHKQPPPARPDFMKRSSFTSSKEASPASTGVLPDSILNKLFQYADLHELMQYRLVSRHWLELIGTSPHILHHLDLTPYNRKLSDDVLTKIIGPFVGSRPRHIDISNCFHITDEGFLALAAACGANVKTWRMKSVWDVTAPVILDMANRAKGLEEIDLSNCRKVSDTLLARIVGWVVPNMPPQQPQVSRPVLNPHAARAQAAQQAAATQQPPPGSIIGCPELKRITLSYCKHVTDRSMHHIASHAANRIEQMDLTRCTTITDTGFQYWGNAQFLRLKKLCLADCTYLTDNAIVYLANAAKGLRELDLSFCCALSDTSTEVLSLGCPNLTHLSLSFCGSAVSDASLRLVGLHLNSLRELSVRGCVRVTGAGVEGVVEGCRQLEVLDASQCKNLGPWLESGGMEREKYRGVVRWEKGGGGCSGRGGGVVR